MKRQLTGFGVSWVIVVLLTCLGCGTVDVMTDVDGGDASGTAGTGGSTTGQAGTGGAPSCTPDACNTCVNGVKTPMADGTSCDTTWCDPSKTATSPFGGSYTTTTVAPTCKAGACVNTAVKCADQPCSCANVGYAGCFNDSGPARCRCVNSTGSFCD